MVAARHNSNGYLLEAIAHLGRRDSEPHSVWTIENVDRTTDLVGARSASPAPAKESIIGGAQAFTAGYEYRLDQNS